MFYRPVEGFPKCPLPLMESKGVDKFVEWDNWARNELMSAGSHLLGKFSNLQVLLLIFLFLLAFIFELFSNLDPENS